MKRQLHANVTNEKSQQNSGNVVNIRFFRFFHFFCSFRFAHDPVASKYNADNQRETTRYTQQWHRKVNPQKVNGCLLAITHRYNTVSNASIVGRKLTFQPELHHNSSNYHPFHRFKQSHSIHLNSLPFHQRFQSPFSCLHQARVQTRSINPSSASSYQRDVPDERTRAILFL